MKTAFERDFFLEKVGVSLLEVYIYTYFFFGGMIRYLGVFFLFFFGNFDAHFSLTKRVFFFGCVLRMRVCRWSAPSS